ncbi:GTPase family protein [Calothrix rhizosoleniae]|uniref:GTPase family protein n=1 Tax=Calothrix rhizosoleniae TaxID=888997 RepID=UPI000B49FA7B|nr:GTPase family protein [Calothrix rhizosoleniae]
MVRLKLWQWIILIMPIAIIIGFLLLAAGWQIHNWGINWIWAIFTLMLVGWRWLLVTWTSPVVRELETAIAQVNQELAFQTTSTISINTEENTTSQVETALQDILVKSQGDPLIWEDWQTFWQRCQNLVVAIANIYHPEVKYPLLNIYIPQAYGLIRGTVDDMDQWMQKLSPVLNQVSVGQAYQAYEVYQRLEPSARKLLQVLNWAQWLLNPIAALAKNASQGSSEQATQQLLVNLGQLLREVALRNLCRQAVALYSRDTLPTLELTNIPAQLPETKTQTLREILTQAQPVEVVEQKPVDILLVGRTGSGKSSLINTLFQSEKAAVDVLPSTDKLQSYHWESPTGETLTLWDTPGYEQVSRGDLRQLVLDYAHKADLLLLINPALYPALQMDIDFLQIITTEVTNLPVITAVTQVDRLRPIREWQPPYNWQLGDSPKENNIRQAVEYRMQELEKYCQLVLPIVNNDISIGRDAWGIDALSLGLLQAIAPAKQLRLARFLRNLEARTVAAAQIIDRYTLQMATSEGLTALLKSPVLQFISTQSTGSPALGNLLAQQISVEQLPVVIGKLQMAYDLFSLLNTADNPIKFDLLILWKILTRKNGSSDNYAWAFGQTLVEYWTQNLTIEQLYQRYEYYSATGK